MSYTETRARFAEVLDTVIQDSEEVVITRAGVEATVLVSLSEYQSLKETDYLLRNPANAERLLRAAAQSRMGGDVRHTVLEVKDAKDRPGWAGSAWDDYLWWHAHDRRILGRINLLVEHIRRSASEGIGSPEALRHQLSGFWSRRINDEHRLIYRIGSKGLLHIVSVRYHYGK